MMMMIICEFCERGSDLSAIICDNKTWLAGIYNWTEHNYFGTSTRELGTRVGSDASVCGYLADRRLGNKPTGQQLIWAKKIGRLGDKISR